MNTVDIEINKALEGYREQCAKQGVSRSMDHEAATIMHALMGADPMDAIQSEAFGNLTVQWQMPHIIRALIQIGNGADTDDDKPAQKPKRKKAKETGE